MSLPPEWPVLTASTDWDTAQAALDAAGLGDGLPLVPPTLARLDAMLDGVVDCDAELGHLPPLMGLLTARTIAYTCVLAGCRAQELQVVQAAALACLEPELNILGVTTTTGSAAIATIIHGPVAASLGMNASINCLGPGNRANASIGRAINLVLRHIGGAVAGVGDMATVGQPAKYTCCFAEADTAFLPPLSVRRGLPATAGAITVFAISGTAEVLPAEDRDTPAMILDPMADVMAASWRTNGAHRQPTPPEQIFILPPELAERLTLHGWTLDRIQQHIFERAQDAGAQIAASPADIHPIVTGGPGVKMAYLPLWGGGSRLVTRRIPT